MVVTGTVVVVDIAVVADIAAEADIEIEVDIVAGVVACIAILEVGNLEGCIGLVVGIVVVVLQEGLLE